MITILKFSELLLRALKYLLLISSLIGFILIILISILIFFDIEIPLKDLSGWKLFFLLVFFVVLFPISLIFDSLEKFVYSHKMARIGKKFIKYKDLDENKAAKYKKILDKELTKYNLKL